MIGEHLDKYTFDYLMSEALNSVTNTVDKREGSIIYDALAPLCYRMSELYQMVKLIYKETFIDTTQGEELDYRVAEMGLSRYPATSAKRKAYFAATDNEPISVPLGSRFSTISDTAPLVYSVESAYSVNGIDQPGYYLLQCETLGSIGNGYAGGMTNITFIPGLSSATMLDLITPGRNIETDDELKSRYLSIVNQKPFGGNISQYRQELKEIIGVGDVQIYPTWEGGGTVKCSIIDADYSVISQEFLNSVQLLIDPENIDGQRGTGLGLAPIDHQVTIVTPDEFVVDVSAHLVLASGYVIGQVEPLINTALNKYFLNLRQNWGVADDYNIYKLSVFVSQVINAVLGVEGVANVQGVTLNGVDEDIELVENATTQQLPILGEVSLIV